MTDNVTRVEGFIVLTRDQRWAWGQTPEDAVRNVRKLRPASVAKANRAMYQLPTGALDAYVDQMGAINWTWAEGAPDRHAMGTWTEDPDGRH